ncbi:MAG TPA: VWA domain-containing protein, partial [Thermoplasmata archaeon]|nr:VWA domain-containing protein [Thermoplasmata archaeon]
TARYFDGIGYRECWALDLSPTFGAQNNGPGCGVPPELVLNEVLYDAANPTDRFVELFYTGSSTLDVTGYRLQGKSLHTVATGGTLSPANRLFVMRNGDSPSAAALFDSLLTAGDNLYLYRPGSTGAFLDEVGWSTLHPQGTSVCRVADGAGTHDGYSDGTSVAAGWAFGCTPSPALVAIGPDQTRLADFGDTLWFTLTATNGQAVADTLDIATTPPPSGWSVALFEADGVTPLADTDLDLVPDVGLIGAHGQIDLRVRITVSSSASACQVGAIGVTATASTSPSLWDSAVLKVDLRSCLAAAKTLGPAAVNVLGTGWGETATLTLEVTARGEARRVRTPVDLVLVLDSSSSTAGTDPAGDRLTAARSLLDLLTSPDRVSVVDFDENCQVARANVGGPEHHLNAPGHGGIPDYGDPQADVDTVDSVGFTRIGCGLNLANSELSTYGDPSHLWVEVLFTDGENSYTTDSPVGAAYSAASLGVRIFTVGLGAGHDVALLQEIAAVTGGQYFSAPDAASVQGIFENLTAYLDDLTAADPYDPITFPEEMIKELLPPYISIVPGSFALAPQNTIETNPAPDSWVGDTLQWKVSEIRLNQTWAVSFQVTCSQSGTQAVEVYPDSRAAYLDWNNTLQQVPFPAMDITCLDNPILGSPRSVTAVWDGNATVGLTWTPPSPAPDHLLVYRAGGPRGFADLSPSAAYATVPGGLTAWTDPEPFPGPGERYYLMRSANAAETDLSLTSNTAGVFAGTLISGMTSISRPLEYFPWLDYSGAFLNTVDEYRAAFGAQWIEYMDAGGTWQRVCPSGPPTCPGKGATILAVGQGYGVNRATPGRFVFTGLPGTHLLFDEFPSPGFVPATTARSLTASAAGDNLRLDWSAVPGVSNYEVLYATSRTGFFDGSAVLLATVPGVTYTHANAIPLSAELYYLVKPAGGAASTYTIGVWTATFAGHGTFSLPLRAAIPAPSVSLYADAIPNTLGILWLTPSGQWVPHLAAMPSGVYDAAASPGTGYQLTVRPSGRYSFVGW